MFTDCSKRGWRNAGTSSGVPACISLVVVSLVWTSPALPIQFPGRRPGPAEASLRGDRIVIENRMISVTWSTEGNRLQLKKIENRASGETIGQIGSEAFTIRLEDGRVLNASDFSLSAEPALKRIKAEPGARKKSRRCPGWRVSVDMTLPDATFLAKWHAVIRDGSNYVTCELSLSPVEETVAVQGASLMQLRSSRAIRAGEVDGSPVATDTLFFACEHPMARNSVQDGRVVCSAICYGRLSPGETWTRSAVIGAVPRGQLRRGFLYYLERERPRPYRPFLHYNTWWDMQDDMNEKVCLERIKTFGRELTDKRSVKLDSLVLDDGWDTVEALWQIDESDFPQGFDPLQAAAGRYGAAVGLWLSPWGGYGNDKKKRLEHGKRQGFETNPCGFSLAGSKYYEWFRRVCAERIREDGVNYFKFDGIGSEYPRDVQSLLRLTRELRRIHPEVYLSITTGTWPSPYWLWYGDSIWRQGLDFGFHGEGALRQQWITYRDMMVYRNVVRRAPLYPLNSLMTVTVCNARRGQPAQMTEDVEHLADEIHMAFGSGTQLLELYVTPERMKPRAWDALAESARWVRDNTDVLVDVHWLGGDPGQGEPYGYASWSPRKGVLVLRNPSDSPAALTLDLANAFELPEGAPREYSLRSRWRKAEGKTRLKLGSDESHAFQLAPFEVLVLEAAPADS